MPLIRALTGLATKLVSRVFITSPRPWGTTSDSAASARTTLSENIKLVMTAMAAARKVVSIYSQMTVPNRRSSREEPCASALDTMTNTSTGAMPFRAPTNRLPNSSTQPAPGTASASTAPTTRPMTMRRIRLVALYLAATAFNVFITFLLPYPDCAPIAHSFPIPLHGTSTIIRLAGRKVKDFSRFFWFLFQRVLTGAFFTVRA